MTVDKRRLITLLPATNQTKALQDFFGVTVDQLYQPGTSTAINGYVGEIPSLYNVPWEPSTYYNVGSYVVYNELLYQCVIANTAATFDPTLWAVSDFYIEEPDEERQNYQLEPGMVSTNQSDIITNALTYPDLINYISDNNGIVSNQQRLFETDYYSWAPPIDIDKFVNYSQYYWFGDTTGSADLPVLVISSPILSFVGNGVTTSFQLPISINSISSEQESPAVYVNGSLVSFSIVGSNAILSSAPAVNASIITTRFDDLYNAIEGQTNFPISAFLSYFTQSTADGFTSVFPEASNIWTADSSYAVGSYVIYNNLGYQCITAHVSTSTFNSAFWVLQNVNQTAVYYEVADTTTYIPMVNNANYTAANSNITIISIPNTELSIPNYGDVITTTSLNGLLSLITQPSSVLYAGLSSDFTLSNISSGMCVQLLDTKSFFQTWDNGLWDNGSWDSGTSTYFVDGVGQSIRLTTSAKITTGLNQQYVTIDRSSLDGNPWSVRNSWVHSDTFAWSGQNFSSRQATRPIIEFVKDIVLYNYGYQRYPYTIAATMSNNIATTFTNQIINLSQINLMPINTVYVDSLNSQPVVLTIGTLLLVFGETQEIFYVNEANGNYALESLPYVGGSVTYRAQQEGDVCNISGSETEYWFNGTIWNVSQTWNESTNPSFMLYDIEPSITQLNDPIVYPGSNFDNGNYIFSYQIGTTYDSVLAKYINYDANGYIIFENNVVTDTYTYLVNNTATPITSLVCYATSTNFSSSGLETESLWFKSTDPSTTTQSVNSNGYYDIPLNLQANPLWDDITTLSKSEYSEHFSTIISNQVGITGVPYYVNNYRDTARNLGSGTEILQHQAPLLKAMLLASDTLYDVPSAIRYADQEYTRFKNRFAKKLLDLYNKGLLPQIIDQTTGEATITSYSSCVILALNSLKIDKNNSFPFWLSNMGGDNYFIPPTPAFLGIMPATLPSSTLIIDTTYESDIPMIQGHDGSLSPAFQDWRDNIFIELETMIYQSIPSQFTGLNSTVIDGSLLDQLRPVFDIDIYISGKFYTASNGYSLAEVNSILSPIFERWVQIGHFDFRTNTAYDPANPFTWNFRGCLDRSGMVMPGSWRAIYNLYFDTDRPHTNPWEMLGFTSQPSWWTANYGTNFSRANTALWNDLQTGTIRSGIRAGVDPRYARPGLSNVIPVDSSGNLLDPISAQIILQGPDAITASRNWVFGDEGPVEHLWKTSSSYQFAKAQAAFLMKPARFSEIFWDTLNFQFIGDQWVDVRTRQRPIITSDTLVHGELETDGITYTVVYGIQQWLIDNIVYSGQKPSILGNAIRGIDVNLIYRMAGFVSSDGLTTQTDNFGLIPNENVSVALYQAPPFLTTTYSGVIVEWTGAGYRVIGYDPKQPLFTIIPPDTSSLTGIISLGNETQTTIYTWTPSTYYRVGVYVNYQNSVYQCITAHTSSAKFNESYWTATPGITNSVSPSIVTYANGVNYVATIPYGSVFSTIQDVGNFLLSWERYLVSQGWVFDQLDSATSTTFNWSHAAKDFLTWAQISWAPGNFIALSPGATGLKFVTDQGTILNVENASTGFYGLLDRGGSPIDSRTVRVNRLDGEIILNSVSTDIYACTIDVADIEHAIVFSNKTIFNDIIYLPLYNQRQSRILLTGFKSSNWAGRLDAPGYIVLGDKMLSNFEKTPEDIRLMFDIEEASRPDLKEYAQHNIGYQTRTYLENLLINTTEQFEFYQGMIAQKGAPGVFEKLLRSQRVTSNSDIVFLEEWAIRYPTTFGAPINPLASFNLLQYTVLRDPQFVSFNVPPITSQDWICLPSSDTSITPWQPNTLYNLGSFVYYQNFVYQCMDTYTSGTTFDSSYWELTNGWIDQPQNNFFPNLANTTPKVPTAGFVRTTDVQYTSLGLSNLSAFYISQTQNGITPFNTGERIWVYTNAQNTWDVLRVFDIGVSACTVNNVVVLSSTTVQLNITGTMNLQSSDIGAMIVIQGSTYTTPNLNGISYITAFNNSAGTIELTTAVTTGYNFSSGSYTQPAVKIFRSVRFTTDTVFYATNYSWKTTDIVWINNYQSTNKHVVLSYESSNPWTVIRNAPTKVDPSSITTASVYNNNSTISGSYQYQQLQVTTPLVDDLTIIDPLNGFLPGAATRDINYIIDNDPAIYSFNNQWNNNQIGQVWWNTSTVKYLDPYTDALGESNERDYEEMQYRISSWATIAPNTSVDVYEWTQSTLSPAAYASAASTDTTGTYGTAYNTTSYTSNSIYSSSLETYVTYYYFWVKNLSVVPDISSRTTSVSNMASLLTSPISQGLEWIAPISENSILISGVNTYLNNTSSVVKIELNTPSVDHAHSQWTLLRPNDQQSLPPEWLWRKIRDSLAGFDDNGTPVPNIGNTTNDQK